MRCTSKGRAPISSWASFRMPQWETAGGETVDGIRHMANLPSEEVFTSPTPPAPRSRLLDEAARAVRRPIVKGLVVRFEQGRAVEITADQGGEILAGRAALDDGAARLGEVALVDRESRIGRLGTTFLDTLLDENAVSHIALGDGDPSLVREEDRSRVNGSVTHIDFMIGGDDVDVTGVTRDGSRARPPRRRLADLIYQPFPVERSAHGTFSASPSVWMIGYWAIRRPEPRRRLPRR